MHLTAATEHRWEHAIDGFERVEEAYSEEHVAQIVERWKHATSTTEVLCW